MTEQEQIDLLRMRLNKLDRIVGKIEPLPKPIEPIPTPEEVAKEIKATGSPWCYMGPGAERDIAALIRADRERRPYLPEDGPCRITKPSLDTYAVMLGDGCILSCGHLNDAIEYRDRTNAFLLKWAKGA